jgi:hypothetical protein
MTIKGDVFPEHTEAAVKRTQVLQGTLEAHWVTELHNTVVTAIIKSIPTVYSQQMIMYELCNKKTEI